VEVGCLLVVLGIELEPAGIPEGDRVLLVVPDRERCPIARLAMDMTMGRRMPAALKQASNIRASPCDVVAE
jgi:hypothetical protein